MRRRVFNSAALLSLLLCVATVVLWVRCYWGISSINLMNSRRSVWITSATGKVAVEWSERARTTPDDPDSAGWSFTHEEKDFALWWPEFRLRDLWFSFERDQTTVENTDIFIAVIPDWSIILTCAILPLVQGKGVVSRKLRQRRQGRCMGCGYSLTGNTSGVCPECGTPISGKTGA